MFPQDPQARRFQGLAQMLWATPIVLCLLAILFQMSVQPIRERQAVEVNENRRIEHQRWIAERPSKIDVRGLSPEQLKEKYAVNDGRTTIKGHEYVLADGALWRVDDTW